jgi:hypothetical protein
MEAERLLHAGRERGGPGPAPAGLNMELGDNFELL